MSLELTLRPTSIDGIKRLADRIERDSAVKRAEALERASRSAGFDNYRHARNALTSGDASPTERVQIYVTCYWHELNSGMSGRETLAVTVGRRLDDLLGSRDYRNNRHLLSFRRKASDHVEGRLVFRDQLSAQKGVCAVVRVLLFVNATGLKPYSRTLVSPLERWHSDPLPGLDHASTWKDPASGELLYTDEPYVPALSAKQDARAAWSARHGLELLASDWQGMYAPAAGSGLYLMGRNAELVGNCVAKTKVLKACPTEDRWTGDSSPSRPVFMSPAEVVANKKVRAPRDPRLARSSSDSEPYALVLSGHSRRPKGRMPLDAHDEVARELRTAIASALHRAGVSQRLERVRCELDDWVQVEYNSEELSMEQFSAMYYGETGTAFKRKPSVDEKEGLLKSIERVRMTVEAHYPDCGPLRKLTAQLAAATKSAAQWKVREG